ncbi:MULTISPECIES: hypothetical protein [Burkholderiales]|uniref:Uncharacterized protein n=1 Tax=Delftia tsuruhatensis TaxID=180282 RepID=A0AAX3SMM0_9BURK|nr:MULTISPECIES: hypothetical protein [Burkholderiales]MCK8653395.1 hypothetical protein [Ralstonia insidiosa]NOZ19035.1 hypothetical protein [Betaproteobacteria bacterium]WFF81231.1 hypothetical protein PYR84_00755 [Delftia tsuruhatensis]WKL15696.1 hypothetical protein QYQ99_25765 [Comamonas testosteroni]
MLRPLDALTEGHLLAHFGCRFDVLIDDRVLPRVRNVNGIAGVDHAPAGGQSIFRLNANRWQQLGIEAAIVLDGLSQVAGVSSFSVQ